MITIVIWWKGFPFIPCHNKFLKHKGDWNIKWYMQGILMLCSMVCVVSFVLIDLKLAEQNWRNVVQLGLKTTGNSNYLFLWCLNSSFMIFSHLYAKNRQDIEKISMKLFYLLQPCVLFYWSLFYLLSLLFDWKIYLLSSILNYVAQKEGGWGSPLLRKVCCAFPILV